jgi:outer membrane protein assembly factor BamA
LKAALFILLFANLAVCAQDDTLPRKPRLVPLPVVFRAPETGIAGGLATSFFFNLGKNRNTTRYSIINLLGLITQRQQNTQVLDGQVYFPKEKNIFVFQVSHSYFPDKFWGLGPDTKNSAEERYVFEQFFYSLHPKQKIAKGMFAGIIHEFQHVYHIQYNEGGVFDSSEFKGKSTYNMSSLGASCSYDTRNNTNWPTKGLFSQVILSSVNRIFFSDYNLTKFTWDTRYFRKIYKDQILAVQLYNYWSFGDNPLRDLAYLGGQTNMRGFYAGRFRDRCMYSLIGEYRIPIYKRFAGVLFGGVGNVFRDFADPHIAEIKGTYGAGLRIELLRNERLNLRIDYGYRDTYNNGFYFTVGECF